MDLKDDDIRLIRLTEVLRILPISKSCWWDGVKNKIYPQPIRIGKRTVAWQRASIVDLARTGLDIK